MKEKALNIIKFINTREWLSFLIVLIASVLFYSSQINAAPLWYDELFSLFWSQLNSPDEVKSVSNWDVAPPGYNLLLHYWTSIFGIKELAVRGLSCLCTSLMVSLLYLLTKKLFGNISALFVLALCLTNTTVFFYANEARCFSFLSLLTLISSFLFILLIKKPKVVYVVALGFVNYYLFYTHFSIIFLFLAQFLFALFYFKNHLLNWYLLSCIVFIVFLFPFLPRVLELASGNGQNHWVQKPTPEILKEYLFSYFNNIYFGVFIIGLVLIGLIQILKNYKNKKNSPEIIYLLLSGIGFIIFSYLESLYKSPLFLKRYLMASNIGVFIVFAYVISNINLFKKTYIILLGVVLLFGFFTLNTSVDKGMNLKKQMMLVKENKTSTTAIFIDNDLAVYYYDINLFKQTYDLKNSLNKNDIFQVLDTTSLINIDFNRYDKIIVANTWTNSDNIKNWLIKKYPNIKEYLYQNDACQTYIYQK